ncbi:hypothetical protein HV346_21865 [Enterobacter sp. RHBSTW-00994]|uniref:hypothetical protein n=1 Tax=Enterobacteriaceae TaxID=543 RepID=UPI0015E91067|nr:MULTISPECIES: hypothetical protein [Enterobacteriaceae]MBM3071869.1 hypothetical protein [Lelliottia sp. RWM.1]QLR45154.1 hypothetical protein HV346_21865 [Enterobacter sp. RHBSTW-00994]
MPKSKSKNCVLVIESPWGLDDYDANRSSVVPFIQGIAKMQGDTEVYFLNFYNKKSFDIALECLCRQRFENTIVYVAAHGSETHIGDVSLIDILFAVNQKSREFNIKGLMLGSCFAGTKTHLMQGFTQDSNLCWCAGYSSSCEWLTGTMIDCAIIHKALNIKKAHYKNREKMQLAFASAISPFAANAVIGQNTDDENVPLHESLQFVIQPEGKGFHALPSSEAIFRRALDWHIEEEDAEA